MQDIKRWCSFTCFRILRTDLRVLIGTPSGASSVTRWLWRSAAKHQVVCHVREDRWGAIPMEAVWENAGVPNLAGLKLYGSPYQWHLSKHQCCFETEWIAIGIIISKQIRAWRDDAVVTSARTQSTNSGLFSTFFFLFCTSTPIASV